MSDTYTPLQFDNNSYRVIFYSITFKNNFIYQADSE